MNMPDLSVQDVLIYTVGILLFAALYSIVLWYYETRRKNARIFEMLKQFKTPPHFPIIGHALSFAGTPTRTHNNIVRMCDKYGPNFYVWVVDQVMVMVNKPEDVERVLQHQQCLEKSQLYRFAQDVVGTGLFTAPPEKWRRNRKLINPMYNGKILDGYQKIFTKCAQLFVDEIVPQHEGKYDVDWYALFISINLDIIMQTSMGVDHDVQRKSFAYAKWMDRLMRAVFLRMMKVLYHPDFIFFNTNIGKQMLRNKIKLLKFTEEVIEERKKAFVKGVENDMDQEDSTESSVKVFVDHLLELNHKGIQFQDQDLRDEVSTIFVGGTDTSSISACFFLTMMGMHQNIQDKVYEEIMDVLGSEKLPAMQDFSQLRYLDRCLKESMRLFCPVPIIARQNKADLKISDGVIPAGTCISISFFYMHRSEHLWDNPLKYDPDRFLPDQVAKRHPYTCLPFSAGSRSCIGQRYAITNLKTQICLIMREYKIHCDAYKTIEDIELKNMLVIRPKNGFKFWLEKRNSSA